LGQHPSNKREVEAYPEKGYDPERYSNTIIIHLPCKASGTVCRSA
jgi:hypothetical protein